MWLFVSFALLIFFERIVYLSKLKAKFILVFLFNIAMCINIIIIYTMDKWWTMIYALLIWAFCYWISGKIVKIQNKKRSD